MEKIFEEVEMDIYNIRKILMDIKETSGSNAKAKKLKSLYKDGDDVFWDLLIFLFDKNKKSNVGLRKYNKKSIKKSTKKDTKLYNLEQFLDYIEHDCTGKDSHILTIRDFVSNFESNYVKDFLKDVVTKKVKIGMGAKSINKALGFNLIRNFNVMRAKKFQDYKDSFNEDFYITLKHDGIRLVAFNFADRVEFFTRSGRLVTGLTHLSKEISEVCKTGYVYDGEVELLGEFDSARDRFRATQSMISSKGEKNNLKFTIFDTVTIPEFENNNCPRDYESRRGDLDNLELDECEHLSVTEVLYKGQDEKKIQEQMDIVKEKGLEGLMANVASGKYRKKRSKEILKIKDFNTIDLRVVDLLEGKGEFEGKLGSFVVEYKGNQVQVGSGLDHKLRSDVWKDKDKYVGAIIEIRYFEESKNKDGKPSLYFPIFEGVRLDKDEESLY